MNVYVSLPTGTRVIYPDAATDGTDTTMDLLHGDYFEVAPEVAAEGFDLGLAQVKAVYFSVGSESEEMLLVQPLRILPDEFYFRLSAVDSLSPVNPSTVAGSTASSEIAELSAGASSILFRVITALSRAALGKKPSGESLVNLFEANSHLLSEPSLLPTKDPLNRYLRNDFPKNPQKGKSAVPRAVYALVIVILKEKNLPHSLTEAQLSQLAKTCGIDRDGEKALADYFRQGSEIAAVAKRRKANSVP